ncbi:S16 family serine protease [Alteribacter natronophilus]|uniref:S16 family serine protease n=1 Tax=Alteribacter natronophilus TaxID=2583810 RepID=UPI00110F397F|nr:S16 family serine protease [Alteribacter natronophilus]TMW72839.1 hypothetical protein FGB90_00560 [Alteribacter natronophilus]
MNVSNRPKWAGIAIGLLVSAFAYSVFLTLYLTDTINGFLFTGALLLTFAVFSTAFLVTAVRKKTPAVMLATGTVVFAVLVIFDFRVLAYEGDTFNATGYMEPIDLPGDSGIHILPVSILPIAYIRDEAWLMEGMEAQGIDFYKLEPITNRDRYRSKNIELAQLAGLRADGLAETENNLRDYGFSDLSFTDDFFERDNLQGNSAGLALALQAMVHRNELENHVPVGVTGAMESDGTVSGVGGIREKMLTSNEHSFSHIIVPEANRADAEQAKTEEQISITVVPVETIGEAVDAVKQINQIGGSTDD